MIICPEVRRIDAVESCFEHYVVQDTCFHERLRLENGLGIEGNLRRVWIDRLIVEWRPRKETRHIVSRVVQNHARTQCFPVFGRKYQYAQKYWDCGNELNPSSAVLVSNK